MGEQLRAAMHQVTEGMKLRDEGFPETLLFCICGHEKAFHALVKFNAPKGEVLMCGKCRAQGILGVVRGGIIGLYPAEHEFFADLEHRLPK